MTVTWLWFPAGDKVRVRWILSCTLSEDMFAQHSHWSGLNPVWSREVGQPYGKAQHTSRHASERRDALIGCCSFQTT